MKYISEFIGTFLLVFSVGMTVLPPNNTGMMAPIAIASALAALIYALGHVSGAHFNPAVSIAVYISGKLKIIDLFGYTLAQILASILASFSVCYLKGAKSVSTLYVDIPKVFLAEALFTGILCLVVLNVAASKKTLGNSYFGLAIGLVIIAGAYSVGPISGGAFNPAVAFGAVMMNLTSWYDLWLYISAQIIAACLAAFIFRFSESQS